MRRLVPHVVREYGIDQVIDIGSGFPLRPDVVELAQSVKPLAQVLSVDNDPVVMAHNRALMVGTRLGGTGFIEADIRDPDAILNDDTTTKTLDLKKPVLLVVAAVLHFLREEDDPYGCMAKLIDGLPSGSVVVVTHADETFMTNEFGQPNSYHGGFQARNRLQVAKFFDGLEMLDPGLASVVDWLPDSEPQPGSSAAEAACYGGAARKR